MIYVVMGPTASGKTSAAHKLAASLNAPIINADAFQIYKEMDIGTAKISKDDPMHERYYMLDIRTPDQSFNVKEYQEEGRKVLDVLLCKNKDVVIVGGTGLYIKALLYDYKFNDEDTGIDEDLLELTNSELHNLLESLDKEEANKIHENNRKRVLRAIMIIRNNNKSKTELLNEQEHSFYYKNEKIVFYYICPDRAKLYERINERVDEMVDSGLVNEVKNLIAKYDLSITSFQGIGYKEIIEYLNGKTTLDEAIDKIKQRTRNYAKRQVTFFEHQFKDNVIKLTDSQNIKI